MEKRLLLAFILSFIILIFWNRLVPPKSLPMPITNSERIINNKNLVEKQLIKEEKGNIEILENENIRVDFSDIHGEINKIELKKHNITLPITDILKTGKHEKNFIIKKKDIHSIEYFFEDEEQIIEKKYLINIDKNSIFVEMSILDKKNKVEKNIQAFSLDINNSDKKSISQQEASLNEYVVKTDNSIFRKENATKFSEKEQIKETKNVKWMGFRNRYYAFIIKPLFNTESFAINYFSNNKIYFIMTTKEKEVQKLNFLIYAGPQDKKELKKYNYNFEEIMCFSNWGILNLTAHLLYDFLHFMYKMIHNWGFSIIITAFCLYFAMYPLTYKSLISMKKMQLLQPEIARIREENKNNPQKLQKETMELYKINKINPLGGCLPILIQMPFFIGIYQVLWRSVSFKNAHFFWIQDLSEPDRLFKLPFIIPFLGEYINILPIFMIITMFLQQKLSNKNIKISDPMQESQQKMMLFVFPIMIGVIFYNIGSGLSLYFTVFYVLSTLTQWKLSKIKK